MGGNQYLCVERNKQEKFRIDFPYSLDAWLNDTHQILKNSTMPNSLKLKANKCFYKDHILIFILKLMIMQKTTDKYTNTQLKLILKNWPIVAKVKFNNGISDYTTIMTPTISKLTTNGKSVLNVTDTSDIHAIIKMST